jgi:hypothetical protein
MILTDLLRDSVHRTFRYLLNSACGGSVESFRNLEKDLAADDDCDRHYREHLLEFFERLLAASHALGVSQSQLLKQCCDAFPGFFRTQWSLSQTTRLLNAAEGFRIPVFLLHPASSSCDGLYENGCVLFSKEALEFFEAHHTFKVTKSSKKHDVRGFENCPQSIRVKCLETKRTVSININDFAELSKYVGKSPESFLYLAKFQAAYDGSGEFVGTLLLPYFANIDYQIERFDESV